MSNVYNNTQFEDLIKSEVKSRKHNSFDYDIYLKESDYIDLINEELHLNKTLSELKKKFDYLLSYLHDNVISISKEIVETSKYVDLKEKLNAILNHLSKVFDEALKTCKKNPYYDFDIKDDVEELDEDVKINSISLKELKKKAYECARYYTRILCLANRISWEINSIKYVLNIELDEKVKNRLKEIPGFILGITKDNEEFDLVAKMVALSNLDQAIKAIKDDIYL